jgi:hypothetical protein
VAGVIILGWLIWSPTSTESGGVDRAVPSSTVLVPSLSAAPSVRLDIPLGVAVPGFGDTITLVTSDAGRHRIQRWQPSQAAPETVTSFDDDALGRIGGVDVSGDWHTLQRDNGRLSVRGIASDGGESWASTPSDQPVDQKVVSSVWHDTDPGRLVWLARRPAPVNTVGTLSMLNMNDPTAGPIALTAIDDVCAMEASAALVAWGDWGVLLETLPGRHGRTAEILLDSGGDEIARSDRDPDTRFVGGGRTGTTMWTHDPRGSTASSFVLSANGRQRRSVPRLDPDKWLDVAVWSPDESRLAMNLRSAGVDVPVVRILDPATGAFSGEVAGQASEVLGLSWSSDSRFLLYRLRHGQRSEGETLVIYDVATYRRFELPLPSTIEGIRLSRPAAD